MDPQNDSSSSDGTQERSPRERSPPEDPMYHGETSLTHHGFHHSSSSGEHPAVEGGTTAAATAHIFEVPSLLMCIMP